MEAFKTLTGVVCPLDRANVDTEAIRPKQGLKSIKRTGFGPNLFDELRYLDEGQPGQSCAGGRMVRRPDTDQVPVDRRSELQMGIIGEDRFSRLRSAAVDQPAV